MICAFKVIFAIVMILGLIVSAIGFCLLKVSNNWTDEEEEYKFDIENEDKHIE